MFIDTHCHLDFDQFSADREKVIARAREENIKAIINVGTSLEGSRRSIQLAEKHALVYAAVGIHPHEAERFPAESWEKIERLVQEDKVVAVGETGLDYFRNYSSHTSQKELFRKQIKLAIEADLPLIVHSREADDETLGILREEGACRGVLHCFSSTREVAADCLQLGFYISIAGQVTYPAAKQLREVILRIPTNRLLIETDAPFLTPEQLRGGRNEPALIKYTAAELAQLYGLSLGDIARVTTLNAQQLFGIGKKQSGKIAYPIRDSLYLNITNRCTNNCVFCVRRITDFVCGHNLKLSHEPTQDEIIQSITNSASYKEVVFCGYGEPLIRLDEVLYVSRYLRERNIPVRIVTNGHGNLIHRRNIVPELAGMVSAISISLNAENKEKYLSICCPQSGEGTYEEVRKFILECKKYISRVEVTALDMDGVSITECERIARDELGVEFRERRYNHPGS
ncbi:MAG: putative metal-dependent hydrolase YcfH [Syntrophomonadaceae bacterium]|nr:putative metal-dependent hydrolase YcfH [Bacillota bacterium]MBT9137850.1 putative metal-dependent hydrolase YcfH [Bacillota bacterium]